jgi:hypothetical protein
MAIYEYVCREGHRFELHFPMGGAPVVLPCCTETYAQRVFGNFQFSEDRCRFFRNPIDGTQHSYSLGMQYPDTRAARNATFAALGCEPVTRKTMPENWRWHQEYAEHKAHGGERLPNDGHVAQAGTLTVLDQLRKSNVRI